MQLHLENPIFPKADIRILMTFVAGKNDELGLKADSHLSQISAILPLVRKADIMCKKFTPDELNKMDHKTKDDVIYQMQDRLDRLEHNYENLVEQIRLANQQRFGRHTEKLDDIAGQLSFFNEAEANYDGTAKEPTVEEVIDSSRKVPRKPKKKGQREEDLKDFPQEVILHDIPEQELNEAFGEENWKSMPDEIFWQLRFEPAKWTAEKHIIKVYVGTDGAHQDEFLRGDHPETMFRGSIATPSLEAAIINAKYVNSNPLDRISRDFQANGLNLSKQTMSNWTVWTAERYLLPVCDLMRKRQLEAHVNQSDETPVDVHVEYIDQETPVVNALATVTNTETEVQIDKLMIASSVEVDNCHLKICDTDGNEIVSWITGDKESIKVNDELFEMGYLNFDAYIDENNSIKVKGLLHDKEYVLSETKPADGYVTASDITFKLVKNDVAPEDENVEPQTTQVMIKSGEEYTKADPNKVVMYDDTTKIEFSKLSITDGQELPGCKMKVTDKETGTVMDEWTSTEFSHMVEGKYVVGKTYILSETKPVDGYATSTDVEFTVLDDGKVQKVSMVDDTTKIEFSKIASDTKEQLKGAKYEVYNSKGKKVYEFKTGKKAELIEGVLKVGETYTFKEVDAPEHYKLAKDVNIKIKDTGKVQKLKAVDVRIPEVPDTPKTGNTTNTLLLALAALLTLMGTGCYACVRAKDKSKYRFKE